MNISTIRSMATRFRNAIEKIPKTRRSIPLREFPEGACGDTSLLLGAYLADQGHHGFVYICGTRKSAVGTTLTHAWLRHDNQLIVDITADQFHDAPGAVIVSNSSPWHDTFEVTNRGSSDFRAVNSNLCELPSMYSLIRSILDDQPPP